MLSDFSSALLFMAVAAAFVGFSLILAKLLRPKGTPSPDKLATYECGETPVGIAWIQFNIRFYVFALIFIIFDVEIVFLFPWAVVFKALGPFAFIEGLIFVGILVVGLAYVWRKGDLAWVKPEDLHEMTPAAGQAESGRELEEIYGSSGR
jgi:NADH-quinone oxidoreductase subunit A